MKKALITRRRVLAGLAAAGLIAPEVLAGTAEPKSFLAEKKMAMSGGSIHVLVRSEGQGAGIRRITAGRVGMMLRSPLISVVRKPGSTGAGETVGEAVYMHELDLKILNPDPKTPSFRLEASGMRLTLPATRVFETSGADKLWIDVRAEGNPVVSGTVKKEELSTKGQSLPFGRNQGLAEAFASGKTFRITIFPVRPAGDGMVSRAGDTELTVEYPGADYIPGLRRITEMIDRCIADLRAGRGVEEEDCFITSAACGVIGLRDDCWELRSLRKFRDEKLVRTRGGPADIMRYRTEAPAIARRLGASDNGRSELLRLYWSAVLPAALCAGLGLDRACRRIYTRMMRQLSGQ